MISEQSIKKLLEENSDFNEYFFVSVHVSNDNVITIKADTDKGITIDECGEISNKLEALLNRDQEDFELEVSSPGLTEPFKILRQYQKNIGKQVDVLMIDGEKLQGTISKVETETVTIKVTKTEKINGKRTKVETDNTISYADIKSTKLKLTFK
ncbi:MAG: ribosome assembly cofactor RimP [Bacteroidales bacterium]|nr:ribosome assembly cofactor RimP [Bacteroidales bacterium]